MIEYIVQFLTSEIARRPKGPKEIEMKCSMIATMGVLTILLVTGVASADQFMNITFDGDAIGSAPSTAPAGTPITTLQGIGGYTATDMNVPPTADNGTIVVDNVAGMNKATVMTTNAANGELGALYMDTGFSQSSSQVSLKFDINVLAAPTVATAQPKLLNDTSDTAGILFGINTYAPSGGWAFRFAVAPTSETGGVFAFRSADNSRLITFGDYVEGQSYNLTLSADYATGKVDALLVDAGQEQQGTFDLNLGRATICERACDTAEDLVNLAVAETLQHGGVVYAAEPQELPGGAAAAAIYRY
jgi:hypothetical protein